MKIIILKDYRGAFYSRTSNRYTICSFDLEYLVSCFSKHGWQVEVLEFSEASGLSTAFPILLTSSEDSFNIYKNFIETFALGLESTGAVVVPRYEYLKAHHNKIAMEQIRYRIFPEQALKLNSAFFGCYEELRLERLKSEKWPKVFKTAFGAGSAGVCLVSDYFELDRLAKKMSRTWIWPEFIYELVRRVKRKDYVPRSLNRKSFLVQDFIPGLKCDYKVLVYGRQYYVIKRMNRKNDFRASGSGIFSFDELPQDELFKILGFARECFIKLANPVLSMDIALAQDGPILLEFQAVCFGPLTAEKSKRHYTYEKGIWLKNEEPCDLEAVFANAIVDYFESRLPFKPDLKNQYQSGSCVNDSTSS